MLFSFPCYYLHYIKIKGILEFRIKILQGNQYKNNTKYSRTLPEQHENKNIKQTTLTSSIHIYFSLPVIVSIFHYQYTSHTTGQRFLLTLSYLYKHQSGQNRQGKAMVFCASKSSRVQFPYCVCKYAVKLPSVGAGLSQHPAFIHITVNTGGYTCRLYMLIHTTILNVWDNFVRRRRWCSHSCI